LHQTQTAADYLSDFYESPKRERPIVGIYVEMNGFAFNTDCWFCNAFASDKHGGTRDGYDFGDWYLDVGPEFVLTGMEDLQAAFELPYSETCASETAEYLTQYLIIARFNELIASSHRSAQRRTAGLIGLPVCSNAHDYNDWAVYESR
jgi:hypothetical protein